MAVEAAPLRAPGILALGAEALRARLEAERSRWPLWLPVCLGGGIACYFALGAEPPLWAALLAPPLAFLALALCRGRALAFAAALGATAFALGFAAAKASSDWNAAPVIERRTGPVALEGRVVEVDRLPEGARVTMAPRLVGGERERLPARVRVRLARGAELPEPGTRLRMRAILMPPPPPTMPGAFDFQRQAWFERLGGVGFALGPATVLPGEEPGSATLALARLRHAMTGRILDALPGETGAIAAALITGERGPIGAELNEAFRDSGLAHLLSISGIHMSLVAGISFVALRALLALVPPLALRWNIKKLAAFLALLLVVAYTLLSGASVPAQRSCFMIALALVAVMVDRLHISLRVVAWAAVAVMALTPAGLLGPSFQMSFAAVVALVAFYEASHGRLNAWRADRGWSAGAAIYVGGLVATSLVATVATTPYAVFHFNRFALYGIAANFLAVPLTGFWVMPWAMIGALLMPFGLESWGLVPMGWGVDAIVWVAREVASWPGAVIGIPAMPMGGLVAVTLGGLWLAIWRGSWRFWGLVPIVLGCASVALDRAPDLVLSHDASVMAVRSRDGDYMLSTGRPGRIVEETWLRRAGAAKGPTWPEHGASTDGSLACDALGCIYTARGRTVALAKDARALGEDCRRADLVVAQVPARRLCGRRPVVVDRIDAWRLGAHAIWLESDGIRIETVDMLRGDRPWVPKRGSSRDRP